MTEAGQRIALCIAGTRQQTDTAVPGWPAEVYGLEGPARDGPEGIRTGPLPPGAVLELELAGGTRILVAAQDAGCWLGRPAAAAAGGAAGELMVGPQLRPQAWQAPAGLARGGLGTWLLKGLRIYREGPAGITALAAAGAFQDAQLGTPPGLYRCAGERLTLSGLERPPPADEPLLLLIHGTASSTEGSFGDLWHSAGPRNRLLAAYGTRICAFQYRSLTSSPIANALDLARTLPCGARLHLLTHSQGGLLGELLARAQRVDGAGRPLPAFTDEEIGRLQRQAQRRGHPAQESPAAQQADAANLRALRDELAARRIRVERFVRVACPVRGTTLLSGRLDRWASALLSLLGPGAALRSFLLAVVSQRCNAHVLPGLAAMSPDAPLPDLLNAPHGALDSSLHVVAGDFQGDGPLPWLVDGLSELFHGGPTDLVVNTPSMGGGAARTGGVRQLLLRGPEVTHFSYFRRQDATLALLDALEGGLGDGPFQPLAVPEGAPRSRGGRTARTRPGAPIVYILPGLMGSHLQRGDNRIWFDPLSLWSGEIDQLTRDAPEVTPDGWVDAQYEALSLCLADSHEVRPFPYDWRLSVTEAARRFADELDRALEDARARQQPLRIVAHSMGGLVARLALAGRWEAFKARPGSRLLQLGTPNRGSHAMAAVLLGRDAFTRSFARWLDWKHDLREFLQIVRDFPGVLELLPWPRPDGRAPDGVDYFDIRVWQDWADRDQDRDPAAGWPVPQAHALSAARAAMERLQAAPVDAGCCVYVTGHAPTPAAVRLSGGRLEIGWIEEGDGRVPWATGIPPGVPAWYADAAHGDLASHAPAFNAYLELLETGNTHDPALTRNPPRARNAATPVFRTRQAAPPALCPSAQALLAAAVGATPPGQAPREPAPAVVEVVHGSPAPSSAAVLVGAYAHDGLHGSARFLDRLLQGRLAQAQALGRYPAQPGDVLVVPHPDPQGRPAGAVVVGLGAVGELRPGTLVEALTHGLLEHARSQVVRPGGGMDLEVAALLVGTGFAGLGVETGVLCLMLALQRAQARLAAARGSGQAPRIARLTLFEDNEQRAIAAARALCRIAADGRHAATLRFGGRLRTGAGGWRGRSGGWGDSDAQTCRIHVAGSEDGGLRFTWIGDRARNEVAMSPGQREAADGLIASLTGGTWDRPGLGGALFELLLPASLKQAVCEARSLVLSLDARAAAYPWELLRDAEQPDAEPLAAQVALVRQLASPWGRDRAPTVAGRRALVVGDTDCGLPELPGAQAEARAVAALLRAHGHDATTWIRAGAVPVLESLFTGRHRLLHLAGHGRADGGTGQRSGLVLGPDAVLTAAQVAQLRHAPEFVFINACHLGAMHADAGPRWTELAAGLATQFIELGARAVIAAGWAVDDAAAETFALSFYEALFEGLRFSDAVLRARAATWRQHPEGNGWGAFQAWGDARWRLHGAAVADRTPARWVHASDVAADLDLLCARLQCAAADEGERAHYRARLAGIEQVAADPDFGTDEVRALLQRARALLAGL